MVRVRVGDHGHVLLAVMLTGCAVDGWRGEVVEVAAGRVERGVAVELVSARPSTRRTIPTYSARYRVSSTSARSSSARLLLTCSITPTAHDLAEVLRTDKNYFADVIGADMTTSCQTLRRLRSGAKRMTSGTTGTTPSTSNCSRRTPARRSCRPSSRSLRPTGRASPSWSAGIATPARHGRRVRDQCRRATGEHRDRNAQVVEPTSRDSCDTSMTVGGSWFAGR